MKRCTSHPRCFLSLSMAKCFDHTFRVRQAVFWPRPERSHPLYARLRVHKVTLTYALLKKKHRQRKKKQYAGCLIARQLWTIKIAPLIKRKTTKVNTQTLACGDNKTTMQTAVLLQKHNLWYVYALNDLFLLCLVEITPGSTKVNNTNFQSTINILQYFYSVARKYTDRTFYLRGIISLVVQNLM
jgi:hypothetical protein